MTSEIQQDLAIEWLILCDSAQISNGKLFLLGGGWDRLILHKLPTQKHFAIAAAVRVPWNFANQRHELQLEITDADAKIAMVKANAGFEVGRPAGLLAGSPQIVQVVLDITLNIVTFGQIVLVGSIDGVPSRTVSFRATPGPNYRPAQTDKQA